MNGHDPVASALTGLDRPVRPDPAFEVELLDGLLRRLEDGADLTSRSDPGRPGGRPSGLRRLITIAATLAIAGLAFALLLPLARLGEDAVPSFGPTPAFRSTIRLTWPLPEEAAAEAPSESLVPGTLQTATIIVTVRDQSAWRLDLVEGDAPIGVLPSAGSSAVWDGERLGVRDAATGSGSFHDVPAGFTPLELLAWDEAWADRCPEVEGLGDATVAGRAALTFRCSGGAFTADVTVDADTGLVVAAAGLDGTYESPGPLPFGPGWVLETDDLEIDPSFDPATFRFEATAPPVGSAALTSLRFGEVAPPWSAPLLDGGTFAVDGGRGAPLAVYLWASWCEPCVEGLPGVEAGAGSFEGRVRVVAASFLEPRQYARRAADEARVSDGIVAIAGDRPEVWGIDAIPTLVLLDGEGRFLGAYGGPLSEGELSTILTAVERGEPLPADVGTAGHQLP